MDKKSHMYSDTQTWNPFKGCRFHCSYCGPSFQQQAKRQKHNCMKCYKYIPHYHEERLKKIPSTPIIFVCGNADISFCSPKFTRKIIESIKEHNIRSPHKTYYFQSKRPEYFEQFLNEFPENVILLTTLETNRNNGYRRISKAPLPSKRYRQFLNLQYPRKVVTVEPIMDFDMNVFSKWIINIDPEYVWLGYNSRPKQIELPEPSPKKTRKLLKILRSAGLQIRLKQMR
jgi:hypothetical protein